MGENGDNFIILISIASFFVFKDIIVQNNKK